VREMGCVILDYFTCIGFNANQLISLYLTSLWHMLRAHTLHYP